MATFTLNLGATTSYVVKDVTTTECSSIYEYKVYATNGDLIDISITGDAIKTYFKIDNILYPFNTSIQNIPFSNNLIVHFVLTNSGDAGTFNEASIVIDNTTVSLEYTDDVVREDDSEECPVDVFSTGLTVDSSLITVDNTLITADNG